MNTAWYKTSILITADLDLAPQGIARECSCDCDRAYEQDTAKRKPRELLGSIQTHTASRASTDRGQLG